ncbi:MAG TPA: ABC transporter permease [bacterium]|jgi:ribose transport system permease protein|nr:ABC transporter permease [bacterium]
MASKAAAETAAWAEKKAAHRRFGGVLQQGPQAVLALFIVAFGIVLTAVSPNFLTPLNLQAIATGLAADAIMAVGMTMVLLMRGLDLSVGAVFALGALVAGKLLAGGQPILFAVGAGLAVSALVGVVNGYVISRIGVPHLIATLATLTIARGITVVVTQGFMVSGFPKAFEVVGQGYWGIVPIPVLIMLVIVAAGVWLLRNTTFFHRLYFIGGNPDAARLSGIQVGRTEIIIYTLSAILAGFAGIITSSRLGVVTALYGQGAELRVIAACVLGGVSIMGGEGTVIGSVLGVILLALISNAFVLLDVSVYWQGVVSGVVLLLAVMIDAIRVRRMRST